MFLAPARAQALRLTAALLVGAALASSTLGQVPLVAGINAQNFDGIAAGLPAGWTVRTGANATALGNPATFNPAAIAWSDTAGGWKNFAAGDSGLASTATAAQQAAATDRAVGVRQTGSFGEPGAALAFNFSTTGLQVTSISFSAQMLSVQPRSTTWTVQYGIGAVPAGWTTLATYADPGVFGVTPISLSGFGPALDNQASVWVRIVALAFSSNSGNRDSFGVDDFTIVTTPGGGDVAPSITAQPASQTVVAGTTATFTVSAGGTAPLAYQWRKDGADLADGGNVSGAATDTLVVSNVQAGDAGQYDVVVSNAAGEATSNAAVLAVNSMGLYWDLGVANFAQDWSDPAKITANDDWSAVPSIIGYLGQDITTGTGVDPQTLTGVSAAASDVDVIANQANPNTQTSGGVAEFSTIANPTIALQGSATADAPHVVLHLDTRGRTTVNVSYVVRDVDGSNDNAVQAVALQYSVGESGAFVNVPAAFVADATQGPAISGMATPVSVALPAAVDNQAKVQLRVITTNAVGADEWVGIDDLAVTSVHDGVARVFLTEGGDKTFVTEGDGSTDTYILRLNTPPSGAVTVRATADAQTQVSADGVTFGATADLVFTGTAPRVVTVRAANDAVNEPAVHFSSISHAVVASADPAYSGALAVPGLTAQVADDDGGTGITRIHAIQGAGAASPLAGFQVTIEGVVTGFFRGSAGTRDGFFVQELDAHADANPATSEGVYVFAGAGSPLAGTVAALNIGDTVTVTGFAAEFNDLTEVTSLISIQANGTAALPAPAEVTLPLPTADYLERHEGMRVALSQALTVTDNFNLGDFGQVVLANGRLPQPTNIAAPGAPAQAQAAANRLNQIVLDDGTSRANPDPTPYLFDDGSGATLRAGDTTTGASGVLTYQFGAYMLEPASPPVFSRANPRPAAPPVVGGSLRIATANVLNLFNGDGAGGGFPTTRGATTYAEYQRQQAKVVAGILALAPDIMGLIEVENDGYGPASSLAQLVDALNAAAPAGTTYAYVDASGVDTVTDLIHSAFIFRAETVETVGSPAMLANAYFDNVARNPLAQTFREKATGAVLTVSVNHFRAKASVANVAGLSPSTLNVDQGDGQGTNNHLRLKQAETLVQWLAADPTGSGDPDFLIIGDLNAYAQEDPIAAIEAAGYVNLTEAYEGPNGYSYAFDGAFGHLDHALASNALAAQVTGAGTWHVNADEPIYYDYNTEDKSADQQAINVGTPFRYSDHDPALVGLQLTAPPAVVTPVAAQSTTVGQSVSFSVGVIGYPPPAYQWRKDGVAIAGANGAVFTIANPTTADAGYYDVVIDNGVGQVITPAVPLTVAPASAAVSLSQLYAVYDGEPHAALASTNPAGLPVVLTYNGGSSVPVNPGVYEVVATINHPDYTGTATDSLVIAITALVRRAPVLNGGLDGSIQVLLPENAALNGNAWVSGDLLLPGRPDVRLNGHPLYGGTIDRDGADTPADYAVTLNGRAVLRHVVRRVDPLAMPPVPLPPPPPGTRNVVLNAPGQAAGDFQTIRNLTLNGNAGAVAVPPGTYGALTANGTSALVLGTDGATEPEVYNLQQLTLNGAARLVVAGPVIVNLANGLALSGAAGAPGQPEWLDLSIAAGGLTLNGRATFDGFVAAPNGTVAINGDATLTGGVIADRLIINGNGLLEQRP
ncbi:MAG TPA: ExeM/NucH family extracellular endonuclease [Opitutaceae bacterium]|nr:ExeM/NucH family extracellular endonuclease [Opitutaceae bacterium]